MGNVGEKIMSANGKKVLLFGVTGELGSRIGRFCVDAGHQVAGVSRGVHQLHRVDLAGVELITGDKDDEKFMQTLAAGRQFDVVIDTMPTPAQMECTFKNFNGKIEHYLMCSSTGVYQPIQYCPADEKHPWREKTPLNFYNKSVRDARALEMWEQDGFPVTIFRPTVILGRGRVPLELWGGRNIRFWQLMKQSKPVEIPIQDNALLQGGCNDDLSTAFANAVAKGEQINGQTYIISCAKAVTLKHYFEVAKDFLNSKSPVELLPMGEIFKRRPEDVSETGLMFPAGHMCFDISKARRDLDYDPKISTDQGLLNALQWCTEEGLL